MPYTKASDKKSVRLYYEDYGEGNPVILIHGWPLNLGMWEYQVRALVDSGFRCISYDRRGFGMSERPWDGHNYNQFADDLKSIIDELGLKDVTLVGFSMGGGEVARYLTKHGSDKVSKAVLISSVVPYLLKTPDNEEGVPKEKLDEMIQGIQDDRPAFFGGWAKQFYGVTAVSKPVSSEILDWTIANAMLASPKATTDCVRTFSETDFRSEVTSITVPTLIIHGDADKIVPIACGKEASKLIPNSTFKVYEGAAHGLYITEKEKLNQDLIEFLVK